MATNNVRSTAARDRIIPDAFIKIVTPSNPRDFGIQQDVLRFTSTPIVSGIGANAQYQNTDIFGGTEPLKHWQYTTARQFNLSTKFTAFSNPQIDVINPAKWCEALQYPVSLEGDSNAFHPPIVLVKIGAWFRYRCVAVQVTTDPNMTAFVGLPQFGDQLNRRENVFNLQQPGGLENQGAAPAPLGLFPVEINVSITFEVTTQVINRSQADRTQRGRTSVQPARYTFQDVAANTDGSRPEDRR